MLAVRCLSVFVSLAVVLLYPQCASGQGYPPDQAIQQMTVADGFQVELVASEPLVRQPVCIEFDDRGRLWVIQYLQYPNPEGLKRVSVDRYSRTEYDRFPEPPPHGPRGSDRITILSDSDGDGRMDQGSDFVDGLNLASGIAFGHGGVFVLNVPYLLFYPDRDRDDVPDSDPQVLLKGFGMQDAHSVANSLTWGPDGWLYGCQGSTVTANIRGIEFQQGVWRYHPPSDRFELFCEGGGNSWGLDFDAVGNLLYSTNYGGYVLLHGVQGGYLIKSFAKHGALHNPHTYGYFQHAPHKNFTGGHVTVGGLVYQGDSFPKSFQGKYIAGDLLGHAVRWHHIKKRGSTFETEHGGDLLQANDNWFAPTDVTMGPDGAIYVADWHDQRTAHPDPDASWDRSNGRIYRIVAEETRDPKPIDFASLSEDQLFEYHQHESQWLVRGARQELVQRDSESAKDRLRGMIGQDEDGELAVELLWTLLSLDSLNESSATRLLDSRHPPIRYWVLRYLGDTGNVSAPVADRLVRLAAEEPDVWVRQQLACTAARLPAGQAMPIINACIHRDVDNDDPYLPLLWWWAIERHSVDGRDQVMRYFERPGVWRTTLGRTFLMPRLIRRYAAEGGNGYRSVLRLIQTAPNQAELDKLWQSILSGMQEAPALQRGDSGLSPRHPLAIKILIEWQANRTNPILLKLAILCGHAAPRDAALATAVSPESVAQQRIDALGALSPVVNSDHVGPLLELVQSDAPDSVRIAALQLLARLDTPAIAPPLLELYLASNSAPLKAKIRDLLLGRRSTASVWLHAVDDGSIPAQETPLDQIRRVALLDDPDLDKLVLKHWGKLDGATREEKLAEVRRLNNDLRAGPGNPAAGRLVFSKRCATCHRLFGEGKQVGPDLTTANRGDRQALLISLVDPSSVIRKKYVSLVVLTSDGRVLTGIPIERSDSGITLVDSRGEATTIARGEIESVGESKVSQMPDDLYRELSPQELRDLFAWLQSK